MLRNYQNSPRSKRNFKSKRKSGAWWANTQTYPVAEDQQEQITETPSGANSGRMDRGLIAITFCLIAIGILMVYSSSHLLSSRHYDGYSYRYLQIHIIACVIGLVSTFMISYVPYRFYAKYANLLLILSFVGLFLVFVPSLSVSVQGRKVQFKRWIK